MAQLEARRHAHGYTTVHTVIACLFSAFVFQEHHASCLTVFLLLSRWINDQRMALMVTSAVDRQDPLLVAGKFGRHHHQHHCPSPFTPGGRTAVRRVAEQIFRGCWVISLHTSSCSVRTLWQRLPLGRRKPSRSTLSVFLMQGLSLHE